jgi:cyclopropane-fatty-acyl-phospholipid synthase
MMYSCAYFEGDDDSLQQAQWNKLDRICRKLGLTSEDHLLEIGTGWGGFAEHAVRNYGCRVTTTTISQEQHDFAKDRFEKGGIADRVRLLLEDYRNLRGHFSKIVSIEMFEAVGLEYYDTFFGACERLLEPAGSMLLQTITINERTFPAYRRTTDWIQKHVFPGSELASVSEILKSLARVTRLGMQHAEDIGLHYSRTLAEWRARFHNALEGVRKLGFDDRFVRMWDYYLAYCEGAFQERHIGDVQIVLAKSAARGLIGMPGMPAENVSYVSAPAR